MTQIKPSVAHPGIASPKGIPARLAHYQRKKMFASFLRLCEVQKSDNIGDIGATSDQTFESSNYIEAWYPHKEAPAGGHFANFSSSVGSTSEEIYSQQAVYLSYTSTNAIGNSPLSSPSAAFAPVAPPSGC